MELGLNNKVIILTGGEENLAENLLYVLSEEGAIVVILGRDLLLNQHRQFKNTGLSETIFLIDVELDDPVECEKAIGEVIHKYGRIEGLVNYPESYSKEGWDEDNKESFSKILQKCLSRYFLITHFALPHLKTSRGTVINISSEYVEFKNCRPSTAAINGGIKALTREWAVELLKYGIRVNSIINEINTPDIGNLVAFLLSEKSSHTTGQIIPIDDE
jgi:L-fucose dehydrogenase